MQMIVNIFNSDIYKPIETNTGIHYIKKNAHTRKNRTARQRTPSMSELFTTLACHWLVKNKLTSL